MAEDPSSAATSSWTPQDQAYMQLALEVGARALAVGEVPVGCVLVWQGTANNNNTNNDDTSVVVSHGANQVNATRDASRHAEIVALDRLLTGSVSTDALRLPASAQSRPAPTTLPVTDQNGAAQALEDYWRDAWVNVPDDPSHWKNQYGWGTGKQLTLQDLPNCTLYVSSLDAQGFALLWSVAGGIRG
jgi:pyrimidine deaminase RibD-like protein